ncbi:MAG: OmpA family protein [Bacteroidetes bacterium]|nr:OmpA family protein [Bacteroidota bacterium]
MPQIITIYKKTLCVCLYLSMLVMLVPVTLDAQSTRKLKRRGDAAFQQQNYYGAAKWYAAVLYDSPLVTVSPALIYPFQPSRGRHIRKINLALRNELQFMLAESYRLYGHYHDALPQYEQYLASQDTRYPLARLWYAESLLATNQPEKASAAYKTFLQKYRRVDSLSQKADQGLANCDFVIAQQQRKPGAVINRLASLGSADGSNFALEKTAEGSFIFTSSRHELQGKKQEKIYPVKLYKADLKTGSVSVYTAPPVHIQMGASSMSADGLTLYFTGWKEDPTNPQPQYQLYVATRSAITDNWGEPALLPDNINPKGYRTKQPFITRDGRFLLFSSDRPGGFGKYDIWMVALQDGKPFGEPANLGNQVNTSGVEATPFYDAVTARLFLSSNGRVGMGGMDIYAVDGDISTNQWQEPVNLGSPVNSVKDDLYYTRDTHSDTAYFSSDRASACCMEIFAAVALPVRDSLPRKPLVQEPAPAARDSLDAVPDTQKQLMDSISAVTVDRLHVNYRFASARIRRVDYPQLAQVVAQLKSNPALNLLVASFTDCIGSKLANEILSRKRSAAVKAYLVAKGIDAARINIDFFGEKHLIVPCKEDSSYNQASQIANRRSDLIVTTEKNPKWTPTGRELDILPVNKGLAIAPAGKQANRTVTVAGQTPSANTVTTANITGAKATHSVNPLDMNTANKGRSLSGTTDPSLTNRSKYNRPTGTDKGTGTSEKNGTAANAVKKGKEAKNGKGNVTKPAAEIIRTENRAVANMKKDSMQTMKITALLDFSPRLKKTSVIERMTSRTPRKSFEVFTISDSVKVELYDNGVFDEDSVSVIYNKELVVYKQLLQTNKPISFYVKLNADIRRNEMIFFAENLGLTPPNSALMIITDGERKRTEINVSSDLEHNSVIYFIKVKK